MYQKLLKKSKLFWILKKIDETIAGEARDRGCLCGGKLHQANYPRKPRGSPVGDRKDFQRRLSFCCSREGCRRRTTPPSVLFLGGKVYFSALIVIISARRLETPQKRINELCGLVGVRPRTLHRWLKWWREDFVRSEHWIAEQGRFRTCPKQTKLPLSLLDSFNRKGPAHKLALLLRFIAPLTTSSFGPTF